MTQYTSPRSIGVADTAKLVRSALKEAFPGIKFSVRSRSYSGGASIDVCWVDGPTSKAVEHVTDRFEGATFDGMIDLKSYHKSMLGGEEVHFGADFIHQSRTLTVDFVTKVAQAYCTRYHEPMPEIKTDYDGSGYIDTGHEMYDVIMPLAYMVDAKDIDSIAVGIERGRLVAMRAEVIALIEKIDSIGFALSQMERGQGKA